MSSSTVAGLLPADFDEALLDGCSSSTVPGCFPADFEDFVLAEGWLWEDWAGCFEADLEDFLVDLDVLGSWYGSWYGGASRIL